MQRIVLTSETDWEGWRLATRSLVQAGTDPATLRWSVGPNRSPLPDPTGTFHVPRALVALASVAIQVRHPDRFGLLYSLVWRVHQGEHHLLEDAADPDLALARRMALAVRSDAHRMRTHLRFLPAPEPGGPCYLGWYQPGHFVLPANAQLFTRRHPGLRFLIATPDGSAYWDGAVLRFVAGLKQPQDDAALQAWWDHHRPALLDAATTGVSIPEPEPLDEAPRPPDHPPLGPVVLHAASSPALRAAAHDAAACRQCPLYQPATQTVFGEGPANAAALFVGEQPGDQEDIIGRPFVGPAGQLMDRALEEAGLDRRTLYVTNAVKHFKFTPRGKRRIHQTPDLPEIQACGPWLEQERALLRPRLLVLMGGSAARAVLRRAVTIGRERGRPITLPDGQPTFVTVHPSYLLRIPDADARAREYQAFVRDLIAIRTLLEQPADTASLL